MSRRIILILLTAAMLQHAVPASAGTPRELLKKIGTFIDTLTVKGVDSRYIVSPERPWQIIVKGNIDQSEMKMKTSGELFGIPYSLGPRLKTEPARHVGVWAGYRGYGLGYSVNVGGDQGSYFMAGITGGSYGLTLRLHSFENHKPKITKNHVMVVFGKPVLLRDLDKEESRRPGAYFQKIIQDNLFECEEEFQKRYGKSID